MPKRIPRGVLLVNTELKTLAMENIYWIKPSGKKILLTKAGDPLNVDLIEKFKKDSIELEEKIPSDFAKKGKELFEELKATSKDIEQKTELFHIREKIIRWIRPYFWDSGKDCSLLWPVICCHQVFYNFDQSYSNKLISACPSIYKRSSIVGTLWALYGLICGYIDFFYLKDLYNLPFLFDYKLTEKGIGHHVLNALEVERVKSGKGLKILHDNNFSNDYEVVINHASNMISYLEKDMGQFFQEKSNLAFIEKHHERISGDGFPKGVNANEISDIESILIFINHAIPYPDYSYTDKDGNGILKKLFQKTNGNNFSFRLQNMVENSFDSLDDDKYFIKVEDV